MFHKSVYWKSIFKLLPYNFNIKTLQVSPPVPVYMKLKFLTVENPDDVTNGSKPQLKELGPFVYRETRRK
jgi:hypothetical protein